MRFTRVRAEARSARPATTTAGHLSASLHGEKTGRVAWRTVVRREGTTEVPGWAIPKPA